MVEPDQVWLGKLVVYKDFCSVDKSFYFVKLTVVRYCVKFVRIFFGRLSFSCFKKATFLRNYLCERG